MTPVTPGADEVTFRPTLFVAVGGLGIRVASRLYRRMMEEFDGAVPPAFAFLCLDSDKSSMSQAGLPKGQAADAPFQQLVIPLRSPQEYRKSASSHLSWISRRWLFNIPRSGNVEGMRPLGRLAFVDHEAEIRGALARQLKSILSSAAITASSAGTGQKFEADALDICIIGATSGGTSSGAMIDVAMMLRRMLERAALRESRISGLLLHATSIGGQKSDAQDANSVSFLKELHYFSLPGAQIPAAEKNGQSVPARSPFDAAHFVHLGDDLTSSDFERHVEFLSGYLCSWSASDDRRILQGWRDAERAEKDHRSELTLRTLGYASIDGAAWDMATSESDYLALRVLRRWMDAAPLSSLVTGALGEAHGAHGSSAGTQAILEIQNLLDALGLSNEQVADAIPGLLRGDVSRRIESYAASVWKRVSETSASPADLANLVSSIASTIGADATPGALSQDSVSRITQTVRQELNVRLQQAMTRLQQRLQQDVDSPLRLQRASWTISACLNRIDAAIESCSAQKADVQQTFASLCSSFLQSVESGGGTGSVAGPQSFCQQYCLLVVCQTVCQSVIGYLNSLREYVNRQQIDTLTGLRSRMQDIAVQLSRGQSEANRVPADVVDAFEVYLQQGGQFRASSLFKNPDAIEQHAATLAADATSFLMTRSPVDPQEAGRKAIDSFPGNAHPVLSNVGGQRRVLVQMPQTAAAESWRPRLQATFGDCIHVQQGSHSEVTVFCEVEEIGIPTILNSLTHLRPRVVEMSERLHCRNDISF